MDEEREVRFHQQSEEQGALSSQRSEEQGAFSAQQSKVQGAFSSQASEEREVRLLQPLGIIRGAQQKRFPAPSASAPEAQYRA